MTRMRLVSAITAFALVAPATLASSGLALAQEPDATNPRFCEGTKIVFFPGGTPGGSFETVVYNGAQAAAAAFGADVTYQWSDWNVEKMISQFGEAVATNPDAIGIMGHPGDDAFKPLVDDAVANGIIVTVMNTELPATQAEHASQGTGYVGQVLYDAGHALALEAVKRGGLQAGDRALVWGLLAEPGRGERTRGIVEGLEESGLTVDYLEIDSDTNRDPALGVPAFTGYATSNPDVKAVFLDHGNLTSTSRTLLESAGLDPANVYVAGFDLAPASVQAVKDGFIDLLIDQQQWLQGFMGILQLCIANAYGFSGLRIDTGGGFLDASNVELIAPLAAAFIR
jgi:simple sugar transport system substrate-binding protein